MMASAQHAALCRITAEVEAAKPDRDRLEAFVRQALADIPEVTSCIGWHMQRDAREALTALLASWGAGNQEKVS